MIEKWKRALDENMKVGTIFMGLLKVFDTLNHGPFLAKLTAYGLEPTALKKLENYRIVQVVFKRQESVKVIVHGLK